MRVGAGDGASPGAGEGVPSGSDATSEALSALRWTLQVQGQSADGVLP